MRSERVKVLSLWHFCCGDVPEPERFQPGMVSDSDGWCVFWDLFLSRSKWAKGSFAVTQNSPGFACYSIREALALLSANSPVPVSILHFRERDAWISPRLNFIVLKIRGKGTGGMLRETGRQLCFIQRIWENCWYFRWIKQKGNRETELMTQFGNKTANACYMNHGKPLWDKRWIMAMAIRVWFPR